MFNYFHIQLTELTTLNTGQVVNTMLPVRRDLLETLQTHIISMKFTRYCSTKIYVVDRNSITVTKIRLKLLLVVQLYHCLAQFIIKSVKQSHVSLDMIYKKNYSTATKLFTYIVPDQLHNDFAICWTKYFYNVI